MEHSLSYKHFQPHDLSTPMAGAGPLLPIGKDLKNMVSGALTDIKDPRNRFPPVTNEEYRKKKNLNDDAGPKVAHNEQLSAVEEADGGRSVARREFFWDEWLSYIASAIVALSLIDLSVEFIASNRQGVLCDINVTFTFGRDRYAFVNGYCARFLPLGQYYTLFTLIQGIILLSPHYIWLSVFNGYFELFFALVGMLRRLKERSTGEHHPRNSAIINKIHEEFLSKKRFGNRILIGYRLKLVAQGLCACGFMLSCALVFSEFETDITCPSEDMPPDEMFGRIRCVYGRLYFLSFLRVANLILLGLVVAAIAVGIVEVFLKSHMEALGSEEQAKFTYNAGVHHSLYQPKTRYLLPFSPFHIRSDLDFMLVRLFASDAGYGKIFKDVQVSDYVARLLEADFKALHSYSHIRLHLDKRGKDVKGDFATHGVELDPNGAPHRRPVVSDLNQESNAMSVILRPPWMLQNSPQRANDPTMNAFVASLCYYLDGGTKDHPRRAVIDICFHLHSYAFTISRYFEKVLVLHLDANFYAPGSVVKYDMYAGNLYTLRVPSNVLALPINETRQFTSKVREFLDWNKEEVRFLMPFIIVSGIDDHVKGATVSQLLEHFALAEYLVNGAIMVILTPELVEGRGVTSFEKLRLQANHQWNEQREQSEQSSTSILKHLQLSGFAQRHRNAYPVLCGNTQCDFHISAYKYDVPQETTV